MPGADVAKPPERLVVPRCERELVVMPGLLPGVSCALAGTIGLWPLLPGRLVPATAGGPVATVDWVSAHVAGVASR